MRRRKLFQLALSMLFLQGCGSGQQKQKADKRGAVSFTIKWPTSSRLIPGATRSIVIELISDSNTQQSQTVPRPVDVSETTIMFSDLPFGELKATATAYPNNDGTGTILAKASQTAMITDEKPIPITLHLESTVARVEIMLPPLPLVVDQTVTLSATAYDSSGAMVPLDSTKWKWTAENTSVVEFVGNTGTANLVSIGTATVTVTDTESGVSGSVIISVLPHLATQLTGRVAFQVENGDKTITNTAYLQEYNFATKTKRTLVRREHPKLYNTQNPNYSPDGRWLVFHAITRNSPASDDKYDLYLLDTSVDSPEPKVLTNVLFADKKCYDPHFSPDGTQIIFHTQPGNGPEEIVILDANLADGTVAVAITSPSNLLGTDPSLLRDGSIVYPYAGQIHRYVSFSGETPFPLPDGYSSAYYVNPWYEDHLLCTLHNGDNVDNIAVITVSTGVTSVMPSAINTGDDASDPCRATDSLVLFSRIESSERAYRLFVAEPNSVQEPERLLALETDIPDGYGILGAAYTT